MGNINMLGTAVHFLAFDANVTSKGMPVMAHVVATVCYRLIATVIKLSTPIYGDPGKPSLCRWINPIHDDEQIQ